MKKKLLVLLSSLLSSNLSSSESTCVTHQTLAYQKTTHHNQVVHVMTIDPAFYQIKPARALNTGIGRESVQSIAQRNHAVAAINAGFFEIGGTYDGQPSGILKIAGEWFGLPKKPRGALGWNKHQRLFAQLETQLIAKAGQQHITIDGVNRAPLGDEIIYYSPSFHRTTLSPPGHIDIICDEKYRILAIHALGNTTIPEASFCLSMTQERFDGLKNTLTLNTSIEIKPRFSPKNSSSPLDWQAMPNIVGGAGLLIADGKVMELEKEQLNSGFIHQPHARSALGINTCGQWVWVLVDAKPSLNQESSIKDINLWLHQQGYPPSEIINMTLEAVSKLIQKKDSQPQSGVTLAQLTGIMQQYDCHWALNLDGGGSSALYYNGKIVNAPVGDKNEALKHGMVKRVSDALLVLPRNALHHLKK